MIRYMAMSDEVAAGGSTAGEPDTYPLWTIRYTWTVLNSQDQPTYTHDVALSETEAIDRAVFALDHHANSGQRLLVAVHIKRPDGWSDVPKSSTNLARHGYLYAFQQSPRRPR
jgi:hypothetical protein